MVTVYSKNSCAFCVRAKQYLESKNIEYEEVNIEHDSEAREWILEQGHRTVPQIYINDELVEGGFNGLVETPDTLLLG
jgi:glutaredoxin|tara:strand:+ start:346 stop:579 length:234 start_codon:yes stop_codon:yes gene_type:complete